MKSNDYQQYALSIDFFSQPALNKRLHRFVELATRALRPSAKICDVGGGTGYLLEQILQQRKDLLATLIEPAQPMYRQAKARLASQATLMHATLDAALPTLECQDAFLFCRSLYAFSGNIEDYKALFFQLADNLNPFGQLFIFEISHMYDINTYKKNLEQDIRYEKELFNQHWPVLELALQRFNDGVNNGEFTLFSPHQLKALADETGFDLLHYSNPNLYCFRKRHQPSTQSTSSTLHKTGYT